MSDGRSWEGNWKVRLYERVRERGYDSLTAFGEARRRSLSDMSRTKATSV
ncbi:hypothetical protein [Archangium sp.]